jgi:hypothetical protein
VTRYRVIEVARPLTAGRGDRLRPRRDKAVTPGPSRTRPPRSIVDEGGALAPAA